MKPEEGEAERGEGRGVFGERSSGGGRVLPRLGAISGGTKKKDVV